MYLQCFGLLLLVLACSANQNIFRMSSQKDGVISVPSSLTQNAPVQFAFARHFQDNMVLQRAPKRARIYGFSPDIGAKIKAQMTVSPTEQYYYGTSVVNGPEVGVGSWVITLDPMNITDPVTIRVISESRTITLHNVLFGDVWICSGQSNMEFTVSQMLNGAQEAYDSKSYPDVRLFTAKEVKSSTPLYDLAGVDQNWSLPSKDTLSGGPWKYFSAVCWLFGKRLHQTLGYPIGLVATDWGGTPVEAWSSPDALKKCNVSEQGTLENSERSEVPGYGLGGPKENSCLWNAMINPLLGMTIYGAIWYQGEDDVDYPVKRDRYNCTFPTMIDDWRLKFHQASDGQTSNYFPFGFVQLSAYRAPSPPRTVGFPDIRWHQTADYGYAPNARMPNTFMAVTMDLPDFESTYNSIHPRDKEDVGFRLAIAGLTVAYRKAMEYQGPLPAKASFSQSASTLTLDYGNRWILEIFDKNGFELSCGQSPSQWEPASIIGHTRSTVSLNATACAGNLPLAMRYAWRESPCGYKSCAVYGMVNNFPAPPFLGQLKKGEDGELTVEPGTIL